MPKVIRRPWLWLLRFIGLIVPRRLRADWRQEWEAELQWREQQLAEWDKLNGRNKLALLWHSAGAFADALWLQPQRWEDEMFQDLRFGVRMLLKHPGFTALAVFTLALGIGANTAIFSVVYSVLLKALPFEDPERVVALWTDNPKMQLGFHEIPPSNAEIVEWRTQARSFTRLAAFTPQNTDLSGAGEPERIGGVAVTADFFPLLGVAPFAGRVFRPEEDQSGQQQVIVISFGLWQRRFGGEPQAVGRSVIVNGAPHTIIGVMPPGFHFPRAAEMPSMFQFAAQADAWVPLAWQPEQWQSRGERSLVTLARLQPEVSLAQAQAEMDVMARQREQAFPQGRGWITKVMPLSEQIVGRTRPVMLLLLGAVGLVLLIACANVAGLLFARATARRQEMAVRAALGAGRARIVRQLLTESLLLAFVGSALGLLFAAWGLRGILALSPPDIPRLGETTIDGTTLAFTALTAALTAVLFGLAPAVMIARVQLSEELKAGGRRGSSRSWRGQSWLVSGEIALALVLLIGAGLLLRSLASLQAIDPGFQPSGVIAFDLRLPRSSYTTSERRTLFFEQLLTQLKTNPGVETAAAISSLPLAGANNVTSLALEGHSYSTVSDQPATERRSITADYFKVMSVPLTQGRAFTAEDTASAPLAVIVNEAFVRKLLPDADPLGKRLKTGRHDQDLPWRTIVGVVKDIRNSSLTQEPQPQLYLPLAQFTRDEMSFVVKSALPPTAALAAAKTELRALDPTLPLANIHTLAGILAQATRKPRFNTLLISLFAALALLLTMVGLYGSVAWAVSQRTPEIGIRVALGAQMRDVLRLVVTQGMKPALVGVGIGLLAALGLTRLMKGLLFGVSATDPLTFTAIALLLTSVALLACYLPARKATQIDPLQALRHD